MVDWGQSGIDKKERVEKEQKKIGAIMNMSSMLIVIMISQVLHKDLTLLNCTLNMC